MNSRLHNILYPQLVERDGEKCARCPVNEGTKVLVIDHRDNDNSNNVLSNLQLLCRSCNNKKNPRGPGKKQSPMYVRGDEYQPPRRPTPELEKNERCEPVFRRWLEEKILQLGKMELHDTISSGAEKAGCSPPTANRYLQKMCSSEGKFEVYGGDDGKKYIRCRMQSDTSLPQQEEGN